MKKKIPKNKIRKGLVSLGAIIVLLVSILTSSIFYENSITGNVIKEISINSYDAPAVQEVENLKDLSILNEGWYEIRNGYVFYLESFNSAVPLYIKVRSLMDKNGIMVVDADGTITFDEDQWNIPGKENEKENYN